MKKWLVLNIFLVLGNAVYSQSDTAYVFEFDLKFIGASLRYVKNDRYKLEYLIDLMNEDTTIRIEIRGHVCCGPNKKISENRAKKVYLEMIKYGIPEYRMSYKGYNNEIPAVPVEKTSEDEAMNRRVDFVIKRNK